MGAQLTDQPALAQKEEGWVFMQLPRHSSLCWGSVFSLQTAPSIGQRELTCSMFSGGAVWKLLSLPVCVACTIRRTTLPDELRDPLSRLQTQLTPTRTFLPVNSASVLQAILTESNTTQHGLLGDFQPPNKAWQCVLFQFFLDSSQRNFISVRNQEAFLIIRVCYQSLFLKASAFPDQEVLSATVGSWAGWSQPSLLGGKGLGTGLWLYLNCKWTRKYTCWNSRTGQEASWWMLSWAVTGTFIIVSQLTNNPEGLKDRCI